jgi:hypothetical protein
MRAILKLVLVAGVVGLCAYADSIELYIAGGASLLVLPFLIARVDRRREEVIELVKSDRTMNVMPLPQPMPIDDDIEGKTVRAPMSMEQAHEMHARYAPSFDQQAAIARYEARHGSERPSAIPQHDPPSFDQGRYAQALEYANAFDAQLTNARRTAAYAVAVPRRMARGSYTPQQYRDEDKRSDQRGSSQWDEPKTLIGVKPAK